MAIGLPMMMLLLMVNRNRAITTWDVNPKKCNQHCLHDVVWRATKMGGAMNPCKTNASSAASEWLQGWHAKNLRPWMILPAGWQLTGVFLSTELVRIYRWKLHLPLAIHEPLRGLSKQWSLWQLAKWDGQETYPVLGVCSWQKYAWFFWYHFYQLLHFQYVHLLVIRCRVVPRYSTEKHLHLQLQKVMRDSSCKVKKSSLGPARTTGGRFFSRGMAPQKICIQKKHLIFHGEFYLDHKFILLKQKQTKNLLDSLHGPNG